MKRKSLLLVVSFWYSPFSDYPLATCAFVLQIFHTFFGLSGLCLLGKLPESYRKIDPVYALPVDVVKAHHLGAQVIGEKDSIEPRLSHYDIMPRSKK